MTKYICDVIIAFATIMAFYNMIKTYKIRKRMQFEKSCQYFLTRNMIENRNRFVQIIKANYTLMKFSHENLVRYKSNILENYSEVPEEFINKLDTVLEELQSRITKLEINEMTGDLKEDITYEEVIQLAIQKMKEAKNEQH